MSKSWPIRFTRKTHGGCGLCQAEEEGRGWKSTVGRSGCLFPALMEAVDESIRYLILQKEGGDNESSDG